MLIYLDTNIVIYYVESAPGLSDRVEDSLSTLPPGARLAVSDLTRLECPVKPLRQGNRARVEQFETFFRSPLVEKSPLTSAVFDRALTARAHLGSSLADAIHLAAAVEGRCDAFLTHDGRLDKFADLAVLALPSSPESGTMDRI